MGRRDNRRSMKMRRRQAQRKLKTRLKRQKDSRRAERTPGAKPRKSKNAPKE